MKELKFETKEEWLQARRGRITGTRLKDLIVKRGTGKKVGYYELIAERLGAPADEEDSMERGIRLEPEALLRFSKETGKKVKSGWVLWVRDDDESIALSPDGWISNKEAVEVKCLSSAMHIKAWLEQKIPSEGHYNYFEQVLQYFIVNDELEILYFVFYDPRVLAKQYFVLEVKRIEVQEKVDEYLELEKEILAEVNDIVSELTF